MGLLTICFFCFSVVYVKEEFEDAAFDAKNEHAVNLFVEKEDGFYGKQNRVVEKENLFVAKQNLVVEKQNLIFVDELAVKTDESVVQVESQEDDLVSKY